MHLNSCKSQKKRMQMKHKVHQRKSFIFKLCDKKCGRLDVFTILQVMMKKENIHKIDVFNLGRKGACSKSQLLEIRDKFISRLKSDTCPECCNCQAMLSKMIFVYSEDKCFCTACFELTPKQSVRAFVFIDLDVKDPSLENWRISEELELMHLTHELGVEDTQLLAQSMTIPQNPKTSTQIEQFYQKIGATKSLPVEEGNFQKKKPYIDERKEAWFEMFRDFKERLEEADTDVLDYILGELHDRSDSQLASFVLKQFQKLTYERAKMYGMLQSLSKKYKERQKHPQILFSSSSDNISLSDISNSDSAEFKEFKFQSHMLMQQIDSLLLKHSKEGEQFEKERGNEANHPLEEAAPITPNITPKKIKRVTFLEDLVEKVGGQETKTKRITRRSSKKQHIQLPFGKKTKSKKFQKFLKRKQFKEGMKIKKECNDLHSESND